MIDRRTFSKRVITYFALAIIAVLMTLQLYASHLHKTPISVPSQLDDLTIPPTKPDETLPPSQEEDSPPPKLPALYPTETVTAPGEPHSPFSNLKDLEKFCSSYPAPQHPRGIFVSDRTKDDGPLKIFLWKQITWANFDKLDWKKETKTMCPIPEELQPFFDHFKIVQARDATLDWKTGFAPCWFWQTPDDPMLSSATGTCQTPTNGDLDYVVSVNYTDFASADIVLVAYPYFMANKRAPYFESQSLPPRIAHQKWVLHFYDESIGYYPHIALQSFVQQFDLTMGSPPQLMDIPHPTYPISHVKALEYANIKPTYPFEQKPENYIAFVVSNCEAKNDRLLLIDKLIKDAGGHSYGWCSNNIDFPDELQGREKESWQYKKQQTLASYPFGLAAENSNCLGYVTEKFYDILASGAIPVYMGAPDIADFVPEGSYINVKDFATYDDLIHHMKTVDRKPFYKWKEIVKKDITKFCKSCFAAPMNLPCAIAENVHFV
ncbi:4-alpha-L-fucosyltransferase [Linnemannia gamsii]|uniref:Fucosyltransferase n=1 Tax=Linnemannia gamsii TaxID=64522 RepID=A0ABQ7KA18_9FUNG|nr:4-alpha-L-fucosyltransferase [Linnemannia gamsii]